MNNASNIIHGIGYLLATVGFYSAFAIVFSQYCPEQSATAKEVKKVYLIMGAMLFGGMIVGMFGIWLTLIKI